MARGYLSPEKNTKVGMGLLLLENAKMVSVLCALAYS